jgi:hypothetical protein
MAKNLAAIVGGGGDNSAVFTAPKGTTGPVGLAAPAVAFVELGWLSEDGLTYARDEDRKEFRAHQGGVIVKRKTAGINDTFKFQALEWNKTVAGLLYKGQSIVVTTGVGTLTVQNQTITDDRAWVIDEYLDDGKTLRYSIPSGSAQTTGDIVWKTDELTVYEFTVGVNGTYYVISDSPAFIA